MAHDTKQIEMRDDGRDHAWAGAVQYSLGVAGSHTTQTLWQCDALRAGQLYHRNIFGSEQEAESFARRMRQIEPDQMFRIEKILASAVWN